MITNIRLDIIRGQLLDLKSRLQMQARAVHDKEHKQDLTDYESEVETSIDAIGNHFEECRNDDGTTDITAKGEDILGVVFAFNAGSLDSLTVRTK